MPRCLRRVCVAVTSPPAAAETLTVEQIADFRAAFALLDCDGDGVITVQDLAKLAPDASEAELKDMVAEVDAHGRQHIDPSDFITMMARKATGTEMDEWTVDGNGFFDLAKLQERLMQMGDMAPDQRQRLTQTVGKVTGSTVHHWNENGKHPCAGRAVEAWAAGESVPQTVYMAALLQLGISRVCEPPKETQNQLKWSNIHGNVRHHKFERQDWDLPVNTSAQDGPPLQKRQLPKFKLVEYCPDIFHNLRKIFNVNTLSYRASLGMLDWDGIETKLRPEPLPRAPDLKLVGQADAAGKSNAWFFFSADQRYLIKVMTEKEKNIMLRILKPYYDRVCDSLDANGQPRTMLPQIFGMYNVRSKKMTEKFTTRNGKTRT